ncbi:nitrite/sulfite reductase [Hydrogenophaga sp.]|uniref:nitrite/sulfite reductase n=1 Tax=Hydrogenophaga sp. TaxID=1904254 RepID=UPI0035B1FCFA
MYQYSDFDRQFVQQRAAQFRDQLERFQAGSLDGEAFRPLRLQNGWYIQRFAPMLRVAVPYGEINTAQLRVLAKLARDFDHKEAHDTSKANAALADVPSLPDRCAHFTTRQNVQFNWIPLDRAADAMDLLATVNLHGIQTSGNCIRNITTDALAGVAVDEVADPRPFAEIMRQWSTLHPEFAFLPRKFKIAITGAREDRAAVPWHDVGLFLVRNTDGALGFKVLVGGGMGRTPIIGSVIREFLPWDQILNYLEAIVRAYNRFGRRDNKYKARIKILVKAEGQAFTDQVEAEYRDIVEQDGAPHTITQAELDRVSAFFVAPSQPATRPNGEAQITQLLQADADGQAAFARWLGRNVKPHQNPALRAVTLSFKRVGSAPGDASADQLERAAELVDRFSCGEARVTHEQNLVLPWVRSEDLPELWREARRLGLAQANIGLLSDMIACPGGDFCDLANARSLPIAQALLARYEDLDEQHDLGEIDLHISGCINSCGHHHSGHIGILGVDKDGQEWYQVTLGGSDGSLLSGDAVPGKVIGPSFAADEMVDVIEAVIDTYRARREPGETFIQAVRRLGLDPFKTAANAVRVATARHDPVTA